MRFAFADVSGILLLTLSSPIVVIIFPRPTITSGYSKGRLRFKPYQHMENQNNQIKSISDNKKRKSVPAKKNNKRRRRAFPATRALKQFYQQQEHKNKQKLSSTRSRDTSTSFEHKYNKEEEENCTSFEFKQEEHILETPRTSSLTELFETNYCIVAPKKKSRSDRHVELEDVPDTARIDLTEEAPDKVLPFKHPKNNPFNK